MRRLILLRHAKAVRPWDAPGDAERALNKRGRKDAAAIGARLAAAGMGALELALVSPSRRTMETADIVAAAVTFAARVNNPALYMATAEEILAVAAAASAQESVIVIGHNPGLHVLALTLCAAEGGHDAAGVERLADGFATSCAAVFEIDERPAPGRARLEAFFAREDR